MCFFFFNYQTIICFLNWHLESFFDSMIPWWDGNNYGMKDMFIYHASLEITYSSKIRL
jgi:hypothetical protein